MAQIVHTVKRSQEEIFSNYSWWEQGCMLLRINKERCDYIELRVDRVFGREALRQQVILEVGCGGGLICEELAQRGAMTIGIDPVEEAIQTARLHTRESGMGQNVAFVHGYAESLPFASGSFSVIVCLDVLEHVADLPKTLSEISRVLAPGGIFIFDTINRTFLSRLAVIWIGERFFQKYGLVPGLHEYRKFIRPAELQTQIKATGLQIEEVVGFTPHIINGRLTLSPGWFKSVSYIGYATKGR